MKIPFTISITHSLSCKSCDYEASAGTLKAAYFWLLLHLKFRCPGRSASSDLPLFKTLWGLWNWKPNGK
jgi:hypothetical protein